MTRRTLLRFAGLLAAYLVVAVPFETDEEGNWSTDIRFGRHPASDVEARNEAERFG